MEQKRDILLRFAHGIRQILGSSLSKIIVYGSYARGDYTENSDIDIMILTTLPDYEIEKVENQIFDLAYDFELDEGVVISPVLKNEDHFNYWLGALPYYDNVQREGVLVV